MMDPSTSDVPIPSKTEGKLVKRRAPFEIRHFRLSFSLLSIDSYTLPTNGEVLGHLHKIYMDRPKPQQKWAMRKYFQLTIELVAGVWNRHERPCLKVTAVRKKMTALVEKYRRDVDKSDHANLDRDFDYIYDLFDIGKKATDAIIEPIGDSFDTSVISTEVDCESEKDPDFDPDEYESDDSGKFESVLIPKHSRYFKLDQICSMADRRNISVRDVAWAVSSTLSQLSLSEKTKKQLVVDPNKVHYSRQNSRAKAVSQATEEMAPLQCFQFDGKAIANLQMKDKVDLSGRSRKVKKNDEKLENIVAIGQPGDNFLGFAACKQRDANAIFNNLQKLFAEKNISLAEMFAIGCDGAAVNVGLNKGVIHRFEVYLQRELHWLVCLLHTHECILGNIIGFIDGKTTGPGSYVGEVMRAAKDCHLRAVTQFVPIKFDAEMNVDSDGLTNDQRYLFEIAKIVDSGIINSHLCSLRPGPIHNARWMTTASRILRVYVSTEAPSRNLQLLVKYITKVYVPIWFDIKSQHWWYYGAKHLFNILHRSKKHVPELFNTVKKYVLFNSYYFHPENVLIAMISEGEKSVRRGAYAKIIECRRHRADSEHLRIFAKPQGAQLDFKADTYFNILLWPKIEISEPPYTKRFTIEELETFMDSDSAIILPEIPLHTQKCENNMQALTESVAAVAINQEGYMRNKINHRQEKGMFHSKKYFK